MKQITMICTLMFDIGDKEQVEIAKTRVIDLVNKTLTEAGLNCEPQILWNAPTPITSIMDKGFDRDPVWSQLSDVFEDDGFIHVDAWLTEDENEDGRTIAKINVNTGEVIYLDDRARTDRNAQEMIMQNVTNVL